ncbi:MAG: hypothetical protein WBR29_07425 [Gammaproteobacteria bacterium]
MLDRTSIRSTTDARMRAADLADKYIPAADGDVATTDNQPPGSIDSAKDAMTELSAWLKEHPVIESQPEAKDGGAYVERTRIALAAMEDERKIKVDPLNKQLAAINTAYRIMREPLEKVLKELRRRLTDYAAAIEAARIAEANRLRREAEEKERLAREAEAKEQDAIACADVGECADVGGAIEEANASFAQFQKADRAAAVAERAVPVRIGSVMGNKSLSMRTTRKLVVTDAVAAAKAVIAMGLTDKIRLAILQSAKDFEEAHGELPEGIIETFERSM